LNYNIIDKNGQFGGFPKEGLTLLRRLATPAQVQDFLDYGLIYNDDKPGTCFSPLEVFKRGRAHCLEGAMFAAAAFRFHGRPALLLDLRANARDDDHVIAPFREKGRWGAVALSRFCGLRYREPIYGSTQELARSYFEFYYNNRGEKTLREFSAPFDTGGLRADWLYSAKNVSFVGRRLDAARHYKISNRSPVEKFRKADSLLFRAEVLGASRAPLVTLRPLPYRVLALPRKLI